MEMVEYCTEGSCIFFVQPFHRLKVRRCRKTGRLRAFLVSEKRRSTVLKLVIISRSIGVNPSFF